MSKHKKVIAAIAAAVTVGATGGHLLLPRDVAAAAITAPYCGYDWFGDSPGWMDVAGPAGGRITVNGYGKGRLVLVDEDTADEAGLFNGLRDNVRIKRHHKHIVVRVNGRECEQS